VTLPQWTTSCPDWRERIVAGRSLVPFEPLFPAEAEDAMRIFDELRVVDMAGSPRIADVARPWTRDLPRALFGSYDPENGNRLIRDYFLLVAKKNWKSGLAASTMLTALLLNWRESGEFGMLAPTVEAADNCFRPVRDMIKADEELSALLHVQEHIRTVTHRGNGGTLKVVAAEGDTVTGKKWIGTLVDELWAFGKKPRAADMLREATGGLASRPEGFVIYLSTHSAEPPAGVFLDKLRYARRVRDGEVTNPTFLPILYEFPEDMIKSEGHRDPKNWYITNPNMGASVSEEFLLTRWSEEESAGEGQLREHMAKHLNVEVGTVMRSDGWPGARYWEQQSTDGLTLDEVLRRSEVVAVGIDGGGLDDLLGLYVIGREIGTGNWLGWGKAWASPLVLERRKSEAARLRDFERDGDLSIVEKLPDDVSDLAELVAKVYESGLLHKVGLDPSRIGVVVKALVDAGVPEELLIGISQGWRLMGAIVAAERKLAEGAFWHGGQRLMAWSVGNAKVEQRGNAHYVTKAASGTAKIDPLMALFCAAELMATNPESAGIGEDYSLMTT
jgi:phage terminase large subunit-like protein